MEEIKKIIDSISALDEITSVYFIGCGASRSDLYPAYYFLNHEAKKIRTSIMTAKEFILSEPADLGPSTVVVSCSLAGNTPETTESAKYAREKGAHSIALTNHSDSPLADSAEYTVVFDWKETYSSKMDKMIKAMFIACEILNHTEEYAHYDKMQEAFEKVYSVLDDVAASQQNKAEEFAQTFKSTPLLFVTSSGPMEQIAWSFSMCLMMEMQHIPSSTFNDGDFFHGPFELVEEGINYLVLMNDGKTRPMDERTIAFLERFDAKYMVMDAKEFGVTEIFDASVAEYFNPVIISPALRVLAEHISIARNYPLTERRYMWKIEY